MEYPRLMYRNGVELKRVETEADAAAAMADGWTLRRNDPAPAPLAPPVSAWMGTDATGADVWDESRLQPEPKKKGRKAH